LLLCTTNQHFFSKTKGFHNCTEATISICQFSGVRVESMSYNKLITCLPAFPGLSMHLPVLLLLVLPFVTAET
jgi:hypothetical protein